ncbi:MAG TPA: type I-C CRISPR-associated protein Cas8c/Csd1 [Syntrophomonas sp.]|nr:type I-C CRISPR-associated protein Cas8c/Csd1 [Syntrophomonas sp.]
MILQALKEYYDRKAANQEIARDGWIKGNIDFLISLDPEGNILNISDLREQKGKKLVPRMLELPNIGKQALKHTNSGNDGNLLWDNASFVFGLGPKGDIRLQSMIDAIDEWLGPCDDVGIAAVRKFLTNGLADRSHFDKVLNNSEYGEILNQGNARITFQVPLTGFNLVIDSPAVSQALESAGQNIFPGCVIGTCLVTGQEGVVIEATHPVTKGVWGAQTAGASIVSFNKDAFNSYKKRQSYNAPVSKTAASQYTKALNTLLESSSQCMHIGDASTVFWSEKRSSFEADFSLFFNEPPKDNPDVGTEKVKSLFESVSSGSYLDDDGDDRFYVLGLAPNAARIAVRYWQIGTIAEFACRIRQYFEDFSIVKPPNEPEFYSIWRILVNISTQDKSENIPPNLAGDFMTAILQGTPFPSTLLQACLRRIRSDVQNRVKPVRAALLKAYLNRYQRFYPNPNQREVRKQLDINQPSIGYQLGRLFAVLEKIQEEANPGINATITERFYGAACATPVTVFANLIRLKNHHLAKIENKGRVINFEKLLGEIMGRLNDFPAHLDIQEQGRFAIGYYHQRQAFFQPKAEGKDN